MAENLNKYLTKNEKRSVVNMKIQVRANKVLLGATQAKTNQTTATIEESFYIKTETDPKEIKLRFYLKDQDHMSDDDLLGHVSFLSIIQKFFIQ